MIDHENLRAIVELITTMNRTPIAVTEENLVTILTQIGEAVWDTENARKIGITVTIADA